MFRDGIPFDELMRVFRANDAADRLQMSDLFVDAGRQREADLLRCLQQRIWVNQGRIEISEDLFYLEKWLGSFGTYIVYVTRSEYEHRLCAVVPHAKKVSQRKGKTLGYYAPKRRIKSKHALGGCFFHTRPDDCPSLALCINNAFWETMDFVIYEEQALLFKKSGPQGQMI